MSDDPLKMLRAISRFDTAMSRLSRFNRNIPAMTRMRIMGLSKCPKCGSCMTLVQARYDHIIDICDSGHIIEHYNRPTPESLAN